MITVTISVVGADGQPSVTSRHKSSTAWEAVEKAVKKTFGKKTSLHVDNGTSLPDRGIWYGQVIKPNGACMTGIVRAMTEKNP